LKLLIDMNLSPLWVEAFREAEFEAVNWSTIAVDGLAFGPRPTAEVLSIVIP
jgi:hypothetical protein